MIHANENVDVDENSDAKMLPENVQKWIAALRSGKYKQTRGYLKDVNGFCCLGVASDICPSVSWLENPKGEDFFAISNDSQIKWDIKTRNGYHQETNDKHEMEGAQLPAEVVEWLGIASSEGSFEATDEIKKNLMDDDDGEFEVASLAYFNDDLRFDFNKIADFIENNWDILKAHRSG